MSNSGSLGDPTQQPGWTAQGATSPGYAQAGVGGLPPTAAPVQADSGTAYPPSNNTSSSNDEPLLSNGGYSQSGAIPGTVFDVTPIPASGTAFASPFPGLATLTVTGGTVSEIAVAPFGSTTYTNVEAGDSSPVTIPAAASVKITYTTAPTAITITML